MIPSALFRPARGDELHHGMARDGFLFAGEPGFRLADDDAWSWFTPPGTLGNEGGTTETSGPAPLAVAVPATPALDDPPASPAEAAPAPPEGAPAPVVSEAPAEPTVAAAPPSPPALPAVDDLFEQYAHLFDDFDGAAALDALLASDWAVHNQWTDAGHAPLG